MTPSLLPPIDLPGIDAAGYIDEAFYEGIRPDPDLLMSEWADRYRVLSYGAEPGPWRTSRTPYLREIMDSLSAQSYVQKVVFMKGSRLGGTEVLNNWAGYTAHQAPAPMIIACPRDSDAKSASKERINPMIQATPVLRDAVIEKNVSRDSKNTLLLKMFTGGFLALVGANSAAALRARTARNVAGDEIDSWPEDVDGEGDPLKLLEVRTRTYGPRKKIFVNSSPTIRGRSKIEGEYFHTDMRRFYIPCPACGHFDYLTWNGKDWLFATVGHHHWIEVVDRDPSTAKMVCSGCNERITERWKTQMMEKGEWRPTILAADPLVRGYHLSSLYSPLGWYSWAECADEFFKVKDDPPKFKPWVNTTLGETWENRQEVQVEVDVLMARAEPYAAQVPAGVGILIASVDVQGSWLDVKVKGYGAGEESWLIAWDQIHAQPLEPDEESAVATENRSKHVSPTLGRQTWYELEKHIRQPFLHESGRTMRIEAVAIDSGGHHTEEVYRFCVSREARRIEDGFEQRVYAIKGGTMKAMSVVQSWSNKNTWGAKLWTLCVDTAKAIVFDRLKIASPGPGFMHFPDDLREREYYEQLTSEKPRWKTITTGRQREWIELRQRREAWDCEVYALGALYILGAAVINNLGPRATLFNRPPDSSKGGPQTPAPTAPPTPNRTTGFQRGGWMRGLRGRR